MNSLRLRSVGLALLLVSLVCAGQPRKLAPDLQGIDPGSTVSVIVQFATPPGAQELARIIQLGGVLITKLDLIQAAAYSLPASALAGLAKDPNVLYISPDREVTATLDYANPTVGAQLAVQNGWDGTGVGVAIIDSGILQGNDLLDKSKNGSNVSRIVYNQSFVPGVPSAADQYGHGTHVAGIVVETVHAMMLQARPGERPIIKVKAQRR